jgi:hypothetical protein
VTPPDGATLERELPEVGDDHVGAPLGEEAGDIVVTGPAVDVAQVVSVGEGPERLVTL